MLIDEIKSIKCNRKELVKFGITMAVILGIIGLLLLRKGRGSYAYFLGAAIIFLGTGLAVPVVLKPVFYFWMTFARILGFFMTRVILSILFFVILTPVGLLARIFRKDFLDEKIDRGAASYWKPVAGDKGKESYEKQF